MNCRQALSLIATERDGSIETAARAGLEAHLAGCAGCRRARSDLAATLEAWRTEVTTVKPPDPDREWLALRRRHRGAADSERPIPGFHRGRFAWAGISLAAAAALTLALFFPRPTAIDPTANATKPAVARVDSVEVPGRNTSTMVFVDDKSGWLIVWASDAVGQAG